jgi:hypothetical protein
VIASRLGQAIGQCLASAVEGLRQDLQRLEDTLVCGTPENNTGPSKVIKVKGEGR